MQTMTTLSNKDYVRVELPGGVHSFGGNQGWFTKKAGRKDAALRSDGCGPVAAADLLAYLGAVRPGPYTKSGYLEYVRFISRKYVPVLGRVGTNGMTLAVGVNRAFRDMKVPYRAMWCVYCPDKLFLRLLRRTLAGNVPAVLSIPPRILLGSALYLYEGMTADGRVDKTGGATKYAVHNGHFITATALYEGKDFATLEVSTWGRRYYIDFAEYKKLRRSLLGSAGGGVLYVRRRG